MEHRVLWLISILMFHSCAQEPREKRVSKVYVEAGDSRFRREGGQLFFAGKPYSGHQYLLYENGDTAALSSFGEGREEGWSITWYKGKRLACKRFFEKGKKQGDHLGWWENGKQKFLYHFKDDELDGASKEWYANGRPFHFASYYKGHEQGRQQLWWDDGTVRANYFVKDGEQYGLIGRKICVNKTNVN